MTENTYWIPVRNGNRYCSPSCGRGCTFAEHETAVANADKLATALGSGWKVRVWENLGWHWGAEHEVTGARVYPGYRGGFFAYWRRWDTPHPKSPTKAVDDLVAMVRAERDQLQALLAELEKVEVPE